MRPPCRATASSLPTTSSFATTSSISEVEPSAKRYYKSLLWQRNPALLR